MNDFRREYGIDLFDFLFEVWAAKWMVLVVVVLSVAAVAGASSFPRHDATQDGRFDAAIPVAISVDLIDLHSAEGKRSVDALWSDLKSYLPEVDGQKLVEIKDLPEKLVSSEPRPNYLYSLKLNGYSGVVYFDLKGGSRETAGKIRAAFEEAAAVQFQDIVAQAKKDAELLLELIKNIYARQSDSLAGEYFKTKRFLDTPGVKSGDARLFIFGSPKETEYFLQPGVSRMSTKKVLALGVILGLVAGSIAVMFRVAIRRGRVTGR